MGRLRFYSFLTTIVLLLSLSTVVYSDTFTDTFDDPNFTNSNWMGYDTGVQQTWSFPLIGPANSGYHVSTTSSSPPAAMGANNGIEYYSTGLYIEALVRIDSHSGAYASENIAGLAFSMTQGTGYFAAFELDFEGYNETVLQIGIIEADRIVETPVTINFDTFYKLVVNQDITVETANLDAAYIILLFYQGECPACEDALIDLANKYKRLAEKNVRVIAISADKIEQGFQKKLAYYQWSDNYCDFTGMNGENFSNYAVLSVPTLFLLDQEGTVLKKTAMVDELIEIIDKEN